MNTTARPCPVIAGMPVQSDTPTGFAGLTVVSMTLTPTGRSRRLSRWRPVSPGPRPSTVWACSSPRSRSPPGSGTYLRVYAGELLAEAKAQILAATRLEDLPQGLQDRLMAEAREEDTAALTGICSGPGRGFRFCHVCGGKNGLLLQYAAPRRHGFEGSRAACSQDRPEVVDLGSGCLLSRRRSRHTLLRRPARSAPDAPPAAPCARALPSSAARARACHAGWVRRVPWSVPPCRW